MSANDNYLRRRGAVKQMLQGIYGHINDEVVRVSREINALKVDADADNTDGTSHRTNINNTKTVVDAVVAFLAANPIP